jgi:hypothetical protein
MSCNFDKNIPALLFEKFVRTYPYEFSVKTAKDFFEENGYKLGLNTASDYFHSNPMIFQISDELCISRSGFFTDKKFSIKPMEHEVNAGILIPGHRTMPFTDPEQIPDELEFYVGGEKVPQIIKRIPLEDILPAYDLFGQEYIPQVLFYDKANVEKDFAKTGFELPKNLTITVLDLSKWYKRWDFGAEDRLILRVTDWDLGCVDIGIQKDSRKNMFQTTELEKKREQWYTVFEKSFLEMTKKFGFCRSIEEQLAYTYFVSKGTLFTPICGSAEEFLQHSNSVKILPYGVETRLSPIDEESKLVGDWKSLIGEKEPIQNTLYYDTGFAIPSYILDAYILDSLYLKEDNLLNITSRLLPANCSISSWRSGLLLLHITTRYSILSLNYNYFIDFRIGTIRNDALQLYTDLLTLFYDLEASSLKMNVFPKQEIIVLKQLFVHTGRLIEALLFQGYIGETDISAANLSVDGMRFSFEEINEILRNFIKDHRIDEFKLLHNENK